MKNSKYILITPVKNEEGTIDQVIDSVIAQDIIPTLWIIVNDGSTDNSQKIIEEKIKNKKWIILINKEINKVYNWLGYSKVIIEGINYCKMNDLFKKLSISYIGILDSDITIPKDYFKDLIFILEKDPLIGAIAGGVYVKINDNWVLENDFKTPVGGARLYNYDIFEETDYFPNTPSPDRMSDIKICEKGYKTISVNKIKAFQHRKSFGKGNSWHDILKGHFMNGKGRYIVSFSFLHVFLISIKTSFTRSPYILSGLYFFLGYLSGFFTNTERIYDKIIINHSRNFWKRIFPKNL